MTLLKQRKCKISSQILKYKDAYFYSYIKNLIKEYATKHEDRILLKRNRKDKKVSFRHLGKKEQEK